LATVRAVFRLLLVWLLVAAIPVKGIAAVAMLACGSHQGGAPATAHHPQPLAATHAAQGHDGHAHGVHHAPAAQGTDDSEPAPALSGTTHKCSACAACGAGAALPAEPPRFAMPEVGPARFTPLPRSAVDFVTDGPDRPPRALLA
jgi:hypothetical protein